MKTTESRKVNKVFKLMSEAVATRNSVQVKSHRQKLEEKYNSVYNIILNIGTIIKYRLRYEEERKKLDLKEKAFLVASTQSEECFNEESKVEVASHFTLIDDFFEDCSENYNQMEGWFCLDEYEPLI
jgi:hypothetical protein